MELRSPCRGVLLIGASQGSAHRWLDTAGKMVIKLRTPFIASSGVKVGYDAYPVDLYWNGRRLRLRRGRRFLLGLPTTLNKRGGAQAVGRGGGI